ncbi:DUF680 domain-containing protein [Mesorhizobium ciceri]|uniref:DUF680 domain-containing protein n=1 Tax=Mesorhizobium ciceri biovar biserrulae (strain HAMBI 2942 / LMG 23838 / WSM1271) TaxID=765698 RepID=E8TAE7_MESCW|nr:MULTISPECIES: DUF680 domain-containing protein [Mesorhizobium]RUZ69615.1 DUF680 domain-containing protein [Mesorhizobium sp. M7A.F.Ca.US.003.02.2.1]ADV09568.1 protein of unknown function DUF680 [Mesorhizobium ciceri biovar biserrulae WSM1271]AMX96278.1 hypothetical protein A4R28_26390 [Mesorhizobium ciceri]AMX98348.1 hypothetical protein A4R29_01515 [Mesorhizobium ciceri biovar biserrulae]ARP62290.1 hypothetical protein A9K65_001985 [Mesorhizobium sp. WSM1497]
MNKILIAAAAVLAITGSAFAGSDNFGSNGANQPAATTSVDSTRTSSVRNTGSPVYKLLNSSGDTTQKSAPQGADRNLFGNN